AAGTMSKCDLCADNVDAGLLPACVAGCPPRAMDFGELADLEAKYGQGQNIFPLPEPDLTRPATVVRPHREAQRASSGSARIANREEIHAAREMAEGPLIVFTLLAQLAVGTFWLLRAFNDAMTGAGIWLALCGVMAIALTSSFFHLGTWRNAWRAISNLRSSWLSREILFSLLFMGTLSLFAVMPWSEGTLSATREVIGWGAALSGMALVYSMTSVYRLRTVPAWNTWATTVSFFVTTLLLGALGCAVLLGFSPNPEQVRVQIQVSSAMASVLITAHILLSRRWNINPTLSRLRLFLLAMSLVAVALMLWDGSQLAMGAGAAFILALAAEVAGRYSFYQSRRGLLDGN
ncbi:MAG TPA: DmsC/YnfH family molybdoenzyme membrane anchor subunit, partial [Anaerolineae bacterium]